MGEEREARGRPGAVSEVLMASRRTSGFYLSELGNDWRVEQSNDVIQLKL